MTNICDWKIVEFADPKKSVTDRKGDEKTIVSSRIIILQNSNIILIVSVIWVGHLSIKGKKF